ncbi:MAG: succinate dehydrogenase, cytochrome b556 subunit [Rhizobiales bacterium]|nr:succinate dehydrogenase, cytochrome b556 subunit [Hyphomicrobiales bacterium]|tara:strand:+ start:538 stop:927 length:390 start_codon:yes stop_codon:yes gene_type:complete
MSDMSQNRPLSPHLQVYRFIPTMAMSIIHRITGGALYFGTLLLAAWLIAAASGEDAFNRVNAIYGSWFGLIVLFGYTWALVHHMLGGLRHFMWDLGYGFGKQFTTKLAMALPVASVLVTVVLWLIVLAV